MIVIPRQRDIYLEVLHERPRLMPTVRRLHLRSVRCFECQEVGHYRSECAHWKTRICWNWRNLRCCEAAMCSFAHGKEELRPARVPENKAMSTNSREGAIE